MKMPSYMRPKYPVLLVAGLGGLFTVVNLASAQTWTPTSAPSSTAPTRKGWASVASSADGIKLVAAGRGNGSYNEALPHPIYTSADSGMTWTQTSAPTNTTIWSSVASSANGTKLAAVGQSFDFNTGGRSGGQIYTSADSGMTWTQTSAPTNTIWSSVASSADGTKLVAVGPSFDFNTAERIGGQIYTSTNSGATWMQTSAPSTIWSSVASSADGTKLVAVISYDRS